MEKKLFKIIVALSLMCLIIDLYGSYYTANQFNFSVIDTVIYNELSYALFFLLLAVFSIFYQYYLLLLTVILKFIWTYFTTPFWIGKWMIMSIPQVFTLNNPISFFTGLEALFFLAILIISLLIAVYRVKRKTMA